MLHKLKVVTLSQTGLNSVLNNTHYWIRVSRRAEDKTAVIGFINHKIPLLTNVWREE